MGDSLDDDDDDDDGPQRRCDVDMTVLPVFGDAEASLAMSTNGHDRIDTADRRRRLATKGCM